MMTTQCERCFSSMFEPHMLGFRNAVLSCAFCKDAGVGPKHFFQKTLREGQQSMVAAQMNVNHQNQRERREIP